MGDTPNVAGMVADPDFQGLSPADKRAALTKVTGDNSFASLNDGETMQFISRFPTQSKEQQTISSLPNAANQAKQQSVQQGQKLMSAGGYAELANAKPQGSLPNSRFGGQPRGEPNVAATLGALPAIGGTVGAIGGVPGAALGGGAGEALKQMLGRVSGDQPVPQTSGSAAKDIGTQGAIMGATEGVGKYVLSPLVKFGGKQIAKLFARAPEEVAEVSKYFPAKEAIESKVAQTELQSRTAFKSAYDAMGIDAAPVNVSGTKSVAQQAAKELSAVAPVPGQLNRVAKIPAPAVTSDMVEKAMVTEDPNEILKMLAEKDTIPFRQAQQFRSAIETYITKARPSAVVYNALKNVSNSLGDGLGATAASEGKAAEYKAADAMFKEHAADFWNKNAPLKPLLNALPGTRPGVLNRFLNIVNDSRALDALERRGVDTKDIRALLAKGGKQIKADVKDAATLQNLGQPVLNQQAATATRAAVKDKVIKGGAALIGAGGLYELGKGLATAQKRPQ